MMPLSRFLTPTTLALLCVAVPAQIGTLVLPAGIGDDPRSVNDIGNGHVVVSNQVDGWHHFVKVSTPSNPSLTTSFNPPFGDQWFEAEYTPAYGGRLFTGHRGGGLNMIDVSNPALPSALVSDGSAGYHFRGLRYVPNGLNGLLYYNATNQGLQVWDVLSNGTALVPAWNNFNANNDGNGLEVLGNYLFQLGTPPANSITRELKAFNILLPATPAQCAMQTLLNQQSGGHNHIRSTGVFGSSRMVACRWNDGLDLIDATNPCSPTISTLFPSVFGPLLITYWGVAPIPGSPVVIVYCSVIINNNPTPRYHFWWPWTIPAVGAPVAGNPIPVPLYTHDMKIDNTGRAYVVGIDTNTSQGVLWIF